VWKLVFVNRLDERSEPDAGPEMEPEPTRNDLSQLSPEDMLLSCML
jgi:hypothetical protein